MCVIFYALDSPIYSLVIASNRDEFLSRPTLPASWHAFGQSARSPQILSARDASGGGTWLGITRNGAFATLTNFTEVSAALPEGMDAFESRGALVRDWLVYKAEESESKRLEETKIEVEMYLNRVRDKLDRYPGFNLLVGSISTEGTVMGYITNRTPNGNLAPDRKPDIFSSPTTSTPAASGLSNSVLSQPWSKVTRGSTTFNAILSSPSTQDETIEHLFDLLWSSSNPKPTQRSELRNSVLISPLELPTVEDRDWYATRTSTVILVNKNGSAKMVERDTFMREAGVTVRINGPEPSGAKHGRDGGQRVFEWRID